MFPKAGYYTGADGLWLVVIELREQEGTVVCLRYSGPGAASKSSVTASVKVWPSDCEVRAASTAADAPSWYLS